MRPQVELGLGLSWVEGGLGCQQGSEETRPSLVGNVMGRGLGWVQQEVRPQVVLVEFLVVEGRLRVDFCTLRLVETPTLTCERHDVNEF